MRGAKGQKGQKTTNLLDYKASRRKDEEEKKEEGGEEIQPFSHVDINVIPRCFFSLLTMALQFAI